MQVREADPTEERVAGRAEQMVGIPGERRGDFGVVEGRPGAGRADTQETVPRAPEALRRSHCREQGATGGRVHGAGVLEFCRLRAACVFFAVGASGLRVFCRDGFRSVEDGSSCVSFWTE